MKARIILLLLALPFFSYAQSSNDETGVKAACMNYLEGFYEGDTAKIIACMQPTLNKLGYWKNDKSGRFENVGYMSYGEAIGYARDVKEKKEFPKADAPREVKVLDVMNQIACARVTAWWGSDYLLLSKVGDKWMIEQVLWEGPFGN